MRRPYRSEIYMYRNLLWLAAGVFLFAPFFVSFVLQLVKLSTDGDIAYGGLSSALSVVQDALGMLSGYVGLGVLCVSVVHFGRNARGVIAFAFLSHVVTYLSSIFSYVIYGGNYLAFSILMLTADALVNLLVCLAVCLLLLRVVKKKETVLNVPPLRGRYFDKTHPLSSSIMLVAGLFGAVSLVVLVVTMTVDFLDPSLGPPVSDADKIYWITQYAEVIAEAVAGYFIMLLCAVYSEKLLSGYRERRRAEAER